jgi:hypothetical protein
MAMVNGNTYGKLSGDKMVDLLKQFREEASGAEEAEAAPAS